MDQTDEYGDPACNSCEFKVKAVEKAEVNTNYRTYVPLNYTQ